MQGLLTERQAAQQAQLQGQLDALVAQRSELQSQLKALQERRTQLFVQSQSTSSEAAKSQIDARMAEIDGRSARLERQVESFNDRIADLSVRISQSPSREVITNVPRIVRGPEIRIPSITIPPTRRGPDMREVGAMMFGEAVVLALIGFTFWRFGVRRMRDQLERAFAAQNTQLGQLQQAVDTVAVEVERISEAQRYVAKVLTEGQPAGRAPAVQASHRER